MSMTAAVTAGGAAVEVPTATAVRFMTETHARTVFELRAEIRLLRQKVASLTMSAALSETIQEELVALKLEKAACVADLEAEREGSAAKSAELVQANAREAAMQQVLAENETARQHDRDIIRSLRSELDDRSANSARLMVQLHKAKVQYKQFADRIDSAGGSGNGGAGNAGANDCNAKEGSAEAPLVPSPPRRGANRLGVRRRTTYVSPDRPAGSPAVAAAASVGAVGGGSGVVGTALHGRKSPVPPSSVAGSAVGGATYTMVAGDGSTVSGSDSSRRQLPVFPAPVPPIRRRGGSNGALSRHMRRQIAAQADASP